MTDDLVAFLRDRLDDTDRKARAAKPGPWHTDGGSVYARHPTDEVVEYTENAEHIAEHDPARVLAEVDAKRRIIDRYEASVGLLKAWTKADEPLSALTVQNAENLGMEWALRALALPFRDHPDYRPEWAPEA